MNRFKRFLSWLGFIFGLILLIGGLFLAAAAGEISPIDIETSIYSVLMVIGGAFSAVIGGWLISISFSDL